MKLSRSSLENISNRIVDIPGQELFVLPERVLQFGTGVLLRGLPDYFIDKANRKGVFNGRIVVVKSTSKGDSTEFERQDGLYTVCVRGLNNGMPVKENIINASISRVLNAADQWQQVLECAGNPEIQIIISNTTEVGITLMNENVHLEPPVSYPGKLLAFLYARFKAFQGSIESGMVIVPTELIPGNGKKLESIVLELAHLNSLEDEFIEWLEAANHFCNSLVDRIVPGRPDSTVLAELQVELGYADDLLIMCEEYRLWAIEGGEHVRNILSFSAVDEGVIIKPDIDIYRELKLRLLNGTHTLSCGVAFLAGCETVKDAMVDEHVSAFISDLMLTEIASAIPYDVEESVASDFGNKVLDRFRNPHIRHQWISITMQYSSKMKLRCIPVLLKHYQQQISVPELFAVGFAAYIFFMKAVIKINDQYFGEMNGKKYLIQDDQAEIFYIRWSQLKIERLVEDVLADQSFWGADLCLLPGFKEAVTKKLQLIAKEGVRAGLLQVPMVSE